MFLDKQRSSGNVADCRIAGRRFESWSAGYCFWRRRHCRPTGIRTANLRIRGWLHYHSTASCSDSSCPPHCLEPSLPLEKKNANCGVSVCLFACLPK